MMAGRMLPTAASIALLAATVAPGIAFSQDTLEAVAERERELVAAIEEEEARNGPYSEALIGPLTALSLLYEESTDYRLTDALIARVLQVIRANYGLHSLEQAPSIRRLIAREEARGNAQAAWELEQGLLMLASRHREDIRTAAILRDTADRRVDILRRYEAGEFVPEIALGCYYSDAGEHLRVQLQGSRPLTAVPGTQLADGCVAGSRTRARRALAAEAQTFYTAVAAMHMREQQFTSAELRDALTAIVRISYYYGNPGLGRAALEQLVTYATESSASVLPRSEALVEVADWDLLYSAHWGTRYRNSALAAYESAYASLVEHGVPQASIDAIFAPDTPVVLPSFADNPLAVEGMAESTPYIDVSFVIARDGRSRNVRVLERSENLTRAEQRRLVNTIRHSRFRPRMVDGQLADSGPLVMRYYVRD